MENFPNLGKTTNYYLLVLLLLLSFDAPKVEGFLLRGGNPADRALSASADSITCTLQLYSTVAYYTGKLTRW